MSIHYSRIGSEIYDQGMSLTFLVLNKQNVLLKIRVSDLSLSRSLSSLTLSLLALSRSLSLSLSLSRSRSLSPPPPLSLSLSRSSPLSLSILSLSLSLSFSRSRSHPNFKIVLYNIKLQKLSNYNKHKYFSEQQISSYCSTLISEGTCVSFPSLEQHL